MDMDCILLFYKEHQLHIGLLGKSKVSLTSQAAEVNLNHNHIRQSNDITCAYCGTLAKDNISVGIFSSYKQNWNKEFPR